MSTAETSQLFEIVQTHAFNSLSWHGRHTSNLYLDHRIVSPGELLGQNITVDRPTILVFLDDEPLTGFGHLCRYLLYDQTGSLYREIQAQFPPYATLPDTLQAFHQPIRTSPQANTFFVRPKLWCPILLPKGERYAILFAGMSGMENLNNHEFCYRMLVDRYGFKPQNIYVLQFDGTLNTRTGPAGAWPGDGSPYRIRISGQGTRAALQWAFKDLKAKLRPQDHLFIHTENCAGTDGHAYFATYPNWGAYYAADFAVDLSGLPHYQSLIVLLAQCYAGGFSSAVLTGTTAANTSVACATSAFRSATSTPDGQFAKFGMDWLSAQIGHDPYGAPLAFNPDTDGDGVIEAEEAFNYALANRSMLDQPSFSETSEAGGDITLAQPYIFWRWWCWLVLPILERYYVQPVGPDFHARLNSLIPRLRELATPAIDRMALQLHAELAPAVTSLIESAVGREHR
jgi:hypothetical protein